MDYRQSLDFEGDTSRVVEQAVVILTALGFRLAEQDARSVSFRGPGMNSTRQPALVGASYLRLTHGEGHLLLEADLGGARHLERFVTWFPPALAALLALVLATVLGLHFGWAVVPIVVSTALLSVLPWKLLSPLMARKIRARSVQALDTLLVNLAAPRL